MKMYTMGIYASACGLSWMLCCAVVGCVGGISTSGGNNAASHALPQFVAFMPEDGIAAEGERFSSDGQIMRRDDASGNYTLWLMTGQNAACDIDVPPEGAGQYEIHARYSNDHYGPFEHVIVLVNGISAGEFIPLDTGSLGMGWNVFYETGVIGTVTLNEGSNPVELRVDDGDGYGIEIDMIWFVKIAS